MQSTDYIKLDDPSLFEERRRLREELEELPPCHTDRGRLAGQFDAVTQEFDRRARGAWATGGQDEGCRS
jgi:hypothetical protein